MKTMGADNPCNRHSRMAFQPSERLMRCSADPDGSTASLINRIRIHPEAKRILGNSIIAIVRLERLNVPAAPRLITSELKPMVAHKQIPCQLDSEMVDSSHQNGSNPNKSNMEDTTSVSPRPMSPDPLASDSTDTACWTPDLLYSHTSPVEPEESSFHDQTFSNTPYPHLHSSWAHLAIESTELAPLDLDLDPDQDMVIQVDPDRGLHAMEVDLDQDVLLVLEDDALPEAELVYRRTVDQAGDQRDLHFSLIRQEAVTSNRQEAVVSIQQEPSMIRKQGTVVSRQQAAVVSIQPEAVKFEEQEGVTSSQQEAFLSIQQEAAIPSQRATVTARQPEIVVSEQQEAVLSRQPSDGQMESEDYCAVCLIGGELLCCDRCPKVFHLSCHIPLLITFPTGDWLCTLCRNDEDPVDGYACKTAPSSGERRTPYTLSNSDQRRCEKLTLLLLCHALSAPFHEAVSPLARNYYQIIKRPMDLSVIRRKLGKSHTLHYFAPEHFVDDILLMFRNCATFNYPDSEVARAGRDLEVFFLGQLRKIFSDQIFPAASQEGTNQARLRWLNRKRKENYRKKRHVLGGKRYVL